MSSGSGIIAVGIFYFTIIIDGPGRSDMAGSGVKTFT